MIEKQKALAKWSDDLQRRIDAKDAIAFYNNNEDYIISTKLSDTYPKTANSILPYLTTYPLVRRIVDDISISFSKGVNIGVESDKLNDLLSAILSKAEMNRTLNKVDHLSNLLFKVGVIPVFRDGTIELDIITPDNCFVEQREDDPTKITKLYVQTGIMENSPGKVETVRYYTVYDDTDTWTSEIDSEDGSVIRRTEPEPHNLGSIPVAWFETDKSVNTFWIDRTNSLVRANEVIDIEMTNFRYVLAHQAFSILVTKGLDEDKNFTLAPNAYINLPYDPTHDKTPDASYLTPDAKLDSYWTIINDMIVDTAQSVGLSVESYKRDSTSFNSGYQLKLSRQSVIDRAKVNQMGYKTAIDKLLRLITKMYNTYQGNLFAPDIPFLIDFDELVSDSDPKDELEIAEKQLALGLTSRVEILMKSNKDLTREQALTKLKQIDADNAILSPTMDDN